ncbi:c-type cytochrome biogenesis protein CcmI [Shewanella salipaludis]|uniref:C-type cytochrome biogenesis protein CcmI n=1 Tax=Shewanella salipaludis TaxID=2723052 RepID=A0A972G4L2_9GAMM|nr:c-type cytochrome biogenesis protein CcmI [Shewanella salipaludis]NMH67124.1 c-type cytochrome biogenesis protein CcmI [Shewanella salipaludis]
MTQFWTFIALVVLIGLLLIWLPHFRQQKMLQTEEAGVRKQTNLSLFNERLAILEQELQQDLLDQTEFDALKRELEISLLQDVQQSGDESLVNKLKPKGIAWPVTMSILLLVISGYLYQRLGAFEALAIVQQPNPRGMLDEAQLMAQRVQMMEAQVRAEPDNSQAWFTLGHAYISVNRFDDAVKAFDTVMKLVGTHAELIGPKATALYYKAGQQMTPEIQGLIEQALALDPQDPSTLLLVGMNAFFDADYDQAVNAWQAILNSDRQDVDREALINAIATAKMRQQAGAGGSPTPPQANQTKKLTIQVSVASALASQVSATDTLFVFARTSDGSKIPLAATKVSAATLPVTVTLDETQAVGGEMTLGEADNIEVIAVLSKHDSVRPQAGDLQGRQSQARLNERLELQLDTLVE